MKNLILDIIDFIVYLPGMLIHLWVGHRKVRAMIRKGLSARETIDCFYDESVKESKGLEFR